MKTNIFIISCICLFASCTNTENIVPTMDKIELTQEEYISIANDETGTIEESEALELVRNFTKSMVNSDKTSMYIKRKIYSTAEDGDKTPNTNTKSASDNSIPIFEVELKNDSTVGYSLVSADKRFPAVLAYVPIHSQLEGLQSAGAEIMIGMATKIAQHSVAKVEAIKDSLRRKTLLKLARMLDKNVESISFNDVKNLITVESSFATRSEKEDTPSTGILQSEVSPMIKVSWDQTAPYNRKLKQACDYDSYDGYEGRYPAGCGVVCIAQILSYFEPPMFADGITIDWKLLKSSPKVTIYDTPARINQISILMKFIGNRTNTKYSCEVGGSTDVGAAVKNFLPLFNIVADSKSSWNMSKVKASLGTNSQNAKPIIITGACDTGSHAWILDGFQKRLDNSGKELYYVHANMGWSGNEDGYYLAESSMSFQTSVDNYNRNINIYPNVRKK